MTAFAVFSLLVLSSVSWIGTDATIYTLRNESIPKSYILHLEPDIIRNYFNGSVTIDFTMMIANSEIQLNQKDLTIRKVDFQGLPSNNWTVDNVKEVLTIDCGYELEKGNTYRIKIEYVGKFNEGERGFYKSRYMNGHKTRWIAMTHFEPTYARLAFPCWDEPIYRAVFNISIKHSSNYTTVISNMPRLNKTHHADDTVTTYFERSMPMSTYLVAFIVSEYKYKHYDEDRIKIFTKPGSVDKTSLAHSFSVTALTVMDKYTEIPYFTKYPKMDIVTVTDSFANGMTNWGLVTIREDHLLIEDGVSTSMDKYNVLTTISHEFAHQWFGNLGRPKSLVFTRLNEGIATYFQYFIMHRLSPAWRCKDLFPVEAMQQNAFLWEKVITSSMNEIAGNLNEIATLRDVILYAKAGCVIRMLSYILMEEVFQTAMKKYLDDNSYGVADSDNLIGHLQDAAGRSMTWGGVPLTEIVQPWITQPGYPMVTVEKTRPGHYTLRQQPIIFYKKNLPGDNVWWIPITFATNHNLNFRGTPVTRWMNPRDSSLKIFEPGTDWILLNMQQTGYYRVNYDHEIWQKLTWYLKGRHMYRIHPVNRAQLIDDALAMALINHTKYETALNLTLYLYREVDYIPWMSAFKNLEFLRPLISHSKNYTVFKHYIRYIMHSLTKNVTYMTSPKDSHTTKILKLKAMKWACLSDVKECLDQAHTQFNAWLNVRYHNLDSDLKSTILCTGLRNASEAVWDEVLKKLSPETFDRDRGTNPLEVLGCSNNRKILKKFLIYSAQLDGNIKFDTAVRAVLANTNVTGVDIVMDILEFDFPKLRYMHDRDEQIASAVKSVASLITNRDELLRLHEIINRMKIYRRDVVNMRKQSLDNIEWINTYGHIINEWLLKNEELFKSSGTEKMFTSLLLIFSIFNTMLFKIFF